MNERKSCQNSLCSEILDLAIHTCDAHLTSSTIFIILLNTTANQSYNRMCTLWTNSSWNSGCPNWGTFSYHEPKMHWTLGDFPIKLNWRCFYLVSPITNLQSSRGYAKRSFNIFRNKCHDFRKDKREPCQPTNLWNKSKRTPKKATNNFEILWNWIQALGIAEDQLGVSLFISHVTPMLSTAVLREWTKVHRRMKDDLNPLGHRATILDLMNCIEYVL